jgi:amino acid adenylation domain-containing protein
VSQLAARLQGLSPQKRELLLRQLRQSPGAPPPRPPILPLPRDGRGFLLSYAQQRLWFLDQLEPGSAAYNMPAAVRLSGRLDEAALARALAAVVRRHEVLRTTFVNEDGRPVQRVGPPPPLPLPVIDLRCLYGRPEEATPREREAATAAPAAAETMPRQREEAAASLAAAEIRRPFDLAAGPPVRALLLRLTPVESILVLTVHHIVSDAWSMRILVREVGSLYAAFASGERSPSGGLAPLTVQYADCAAAERQWLDAASLAPQLAYWQRRLAGLDGPLDLPADRPRPQVQSFRGARLGTALPAPAIAALRTLAQREGTTLFTLLLASLMVLLHRHSGRSDLAVGTPIANRDRPEIEPLIGLFVNTLVLRADLSGDPPFRQLLATVRETVLEDFAHRDVPFERLVEELQPERDLAHSPLFQVLLAHQSASLDEPAAGGLVARPLAIDSGRALFDLTVTLAETPEALASTFEYNTDLFDAARIRRLAAHWEALLAGVVREPVRRLSELHQLTAAERQQLLVEGSDTAAAFAWEGSVDELVERQAALAPQRLAVTAGVHQRSYGELAAGAARVAGRLRSLGIARGEPVAVAIGRSVRLLEVLLGVWRAGGAYVPMDPAYPAERLLHMLEDAGCRLLLADEETPRDLVRRAAEVVWIEDAGSPREEPQSGSPDNPQSSSPDNPLSASPDNSRSGGPPRSPWDLAYVLYTSGSTGRPKGVEVSHGALLNFLRSMAQRPGLGPDDVLLAVTSLSFDIAALELYLPLLVGARLELVERDVAADGMRLLGSLTSSGPTVMQATPSTWRLLVEAGWQASPELKALCGGEALPERLAAELVARAGEVWNLYGPTETTVWSAADRVEARAPVRIGPPIANTSLVLMSRELEPVAMGVAGELWIGGAGVARGYRGRPELTAERFVPDPWAGRWSEPGARLYRTGDLARHDGRGRLEFLGRIDHQVKVRGFRIELGEVESALEAHPAVARAVALADAAGGGRLVACVLPRSAAPAADPAAPPEPGPPPVEHSASPAPLALPTSAASPAWKLPTAALRAHLARSLPDYMIPTVWVELASVPLTPSGKVDRRRLAALAAGPSAAAAGRPARPERRAPASPAEELVASIFEEVLGVPGVGMDESFFDLGGHSLLATQVVARVRRSWGIELPLRALFELPTVARLAVHLAALRAGEQVDAAPPIAARPRSRGLEDRAAGLPLSFGQQRLWFLDQLEPGGVAYNMPAAVRLRGALDAAALAWSLGEVVRRHEVLRTVFLLDGEEPVQVPLPAARLPLPCVDLAGLPPGRREATARRLLAAAAGRPFNLATGPLLRPLLLRLDPFEHLLLVVVHHIASDAWSMGLLVRELSALYAARRLGAASPLPELPLQYADYAAWQRGWLRGAALAAQLAYWRRALAGAPPLLDLPTDRPRPARQSLRGGRLALRFDPALGEAVRALGRTQSATAFMIHLAAFQALLGRYSGQQVVVVGTPIANRRHAELEGLIGFFVNTLALAGDLAGEPSFTEHLARVRETALGAYAHQDLPFEKLVEELDPRRSLAHAPLFQVLLSARDLPAAAAAALPGLELTPLGTELGAAKFDLTLDIGAIGAAGNAGAGGGAAGATATGGPGAGGPRGAATGFDAELEYNTDLFDRATAARLLRHFETLLAGALADPSARVGELPILSPPERAQLLVEWNDTAPAAATTTMQAMPAMRRQPQAAAPCLHELLEAAADRAPAERALAWRGQEVTRGELDRRANRLAHHLRALGVGPETRVGICMERSPAMVTAMLAVLKAGGAYLPLDPAYPRERLELMLEDSRALVVLAEERLADRLGTRTPIVCVDRDTASFDRQPDCRPAPAAAPGNLAYVIYTSGSTGRPKGVAIAHRSAVAMVEWARGAFVPGELAAVLASTSICFDLSVFELFVPLACGGSVVLAENALELPRLEAAGVTLVNTVPSAAAELVRTTGLPPSVRTVCLAGEPLSRVLVEALYAAAAARGGRLERVLNLYGPSEDTTYSTWATLPPLPPGVKQAPGIGRPVLGTQAYVLDACRQLLPLGVPGELCLGGQGLARGYLGRPELTAERFVPDPFTGEPGGRLYRTGDLVRHRPDGDLLFLGRLDHQVKLRGFRIELGEIEAVLAAHPRIAEVAVVSTKPAGAALDEQEAGEGSPAGAVAGQRLVAYVVGRPALMSSGASGAAGLSGSAGSAETGESAAAAGPAALAGSAPAADELRAYLAAKLPSFMVPWAFVQLPALPRNANGKLDRGALPDPGRQAWGAAPEVEEPRSEAERTVAAIWQEVLGLDRVSVHDSFFDSGGHSLLAVRAYHRYRAAFGRDFPLIALFENPTIEALARFLGRGSGDGEPQAASRQLGQERGARRREAAAARRRAATPDPRGDHETS